MAQDLGEVAGLVTSSTIDPEAEAADLASAVGQARDAGAMLAGRQAEALVGVRQDLACSPGIVRHVCMGAVVVVLGGAQCMCQCACERV